MLTVIYAPPGTQGGRSNTSVVYGNGSTTGTTTSASQSFKQSYSVSVKGSAGFLGSGGEVGVSFGYARTATDSQSMDIKKSTTMTIRVDGPSKDGFDHDRDIIWLWLNPTIDLVLRPATAVWTLGGTSFIEAQYVYVDWLKHSSHMPPGVAKVFHDHLFTEADYLDILKRDPLANESPNFDSARYQAVPFSFPYEPPFSATDPVPVQSYVMTNAVTSTLGSSLQDEYKVGLTISADASFLDLVKGSVKSEDSWTWTNTSSRSSSTGTTESASVALGGPAFGYQGPTDIQVYYDTIYKTFAFRFIEGASPVLQGTLFNRAGKPMPTTEVSLIAKDGTHRTFTNARGEYRFFGAVRGPLQLKARGVTKALPKAIPDNRFDLRLR